MFITDLWNLLYNNKRIKDNDMAIVAYIRVSTQEQNTDVQKHELLEYAQRHKFMIDEFITVEISSRKSQEQRKIEYLKQMLKSGDTVICTELSRLARSMIEILNLIEYFKQNSISVIFTKQAELSTTKDSALQSLLFSIYGYFAETERELLSQRVKAGIQNARANGKKIGRAKDSFGISIFDIHKDKIKELREYGLSYAKIAKVIDLGTSVGIRNYLIKLDKIEKIKQVDKERMAYTSHYS